MILEQTLLSKNRPSSPPVMFPLWKTLLMVVILVWSVLYTLPNLYPEDAAVQITGSSAAEDISDSLRSRVQNILKEAGVTFKQIELKNGSLLVRLADIENQLAVKDLLQAKLGARYVTALNLAPTTPEWLVALGAKPLKLGLDLRGGVHFVLEVDVEEAFNQHIRVYFDQARETLREAKIRYAQMKNNEQSITMVFRTEQDQKAAYALMLKSFGRDLVRQLDEQDLVTLTLVLSEEKKREIREFAVSQNLAAIRNRVNEMGVAEPLVQRQGQERIVIELPGVQDTAIAKRVIGRTASLEFRLAHRNQVGGSNTEVLPFKGDRQSPVTLEEKVIVTGEQVVNAQATFDEHSVPQVNITLNSEGGRRMLKTTKDHVGDPMAVVFVEHKQRLVEKKVGDRLEVTREPYTEKYVINVATIQDSLSSQFRITGLDSIQESSELALLLRSGALAAPMYIIEEQTVGPTLGKENIKKGVNATLLGYGLVILAMALVYRIFGVLANIALAFNVTILIATMSMLGATLTLPGIAGIVLTVGMSVDGNVLIFARIREEIRKGLSSRLAITTGFDRAFLTIWDANLTGLIVGALLFAIGTGPVKGFAVTTSIGIVISMFTSITCTRAFIEFFYGKRPLSRWAL
jgi:preprotein translocase subunit SecD